MFQFSLKVIVIFWLNVANFYPLKITTWNLWFLFSTYVKFSNDSKDELIAMAFSLIGIKGAFLLSSLRAFIVLLKLLLRVV